MTSSSAAPSGEFSFEQLEATALVTSRLTAAGAGVLSSAGAPDDPATVLGAAIAEGRAQGRELARAEMAGALEALHAALGGIEALRDEVAERCERDAVELALALAEHIVAGAIEAAPERIVEVVRGALRRLIDRRRVTIVVNPDDVELVSEQIEALRGELGGIEHATVQADRRVTRGGAVVRTVEGAIDAEISTQFERARAVVAAELATS
jgi:flagellar assembly protein FliH